MSRVLLGWELGLNLGHLTKLLPIAEQLKAKGHTLLAAVKDLPAAATVLGSAGIPLMQAPFHATGILLPHRSASYADILLAQGWAERASLWGLVQGWLNLMRLFRPALLILDHSPTAMLAARIAGIPVVLVGNGFEIPPRYHSPTAFSGVYLGN